VPEEGSLVGPITRCILSDSFFRYKYGDRFFYDVQGQPGSFTQGTYYLLFVICSFNNNVNDYNLYINFQNN